MFSVHAFATSTSGTYSALTNIAAVSDPIASVSGNFLYVPILNQLFGVYAMGTGILRAQLSSPSLLADVPFDVTPVDPAALPSVSLPILLDSASPMKLVTDEPLDCKITSGSNTQIIVAGFLSDGPISKVSGRILHVRATTTTSSTASAWVNSSLTLTNQLAEGTYQLVGARAESVHNILCRFVFQGGQSTARPGFVGSGAIGRHETDNIFRNGGLGVWGTFTNRVLPTIDTMSDGTSETLVVILDLIKVS